MSLHVIVGASGVGVATARLLAGRGDQVKIVTRSGAGPDHSAIERVAADATDAGRLSVIAEGAVALYNCANPRYDRWLTDWPPLASALLAAAEHTGAVLASAATLYGYGPVAGPMSETTPLAATHPKLRLRAQMWRDALAAHQAGRIRTTEVRASDFIQGTGLFGLTVAGDQRAWGKAWHAPTNPPLTLRQLATRYAEITGAPRPKLTTIPYPVLWTAGVFVPIVRELRTTRYQWDRPFVMNSATTQDTLGLKPEPLDDSLREAAQLVQH